MQKNAPNITLKKYCAKITVKVVQFFFSLSSSSKLYSGHSLVQVFISQSNSSKSILCGKIFSVFLNVHVSTRSNGLFPSVSVNFKIFSKNMRKQFRK